MFCFILPIIQFIRNENMEWYGGGDFSVEKYKHFRMFLFGLSIVFLLAWIWLIYNIFSPL